MLGLRALAAFAAALGTATSAYAGTVNEEPLPRIEGALCPGVMGLSTQPALTMLDRVRTNAERFGIRLADPETCLPNLLVAFVSDGQTSVDVLMDAQPQLFASLSMQERRALRQETGPVRAWNLVQSYTRDGMWVSKREGLFEIPRATMWSAHSKIYTATRRDILSTVVIFDAEQVRGMTLQQLADYASMRGFANDFTAYPDARSNTILELFDGGSQPSALTSADHKFLATLYSGIANLPGRAKERQIQNEVGG